MPVDSSCPVAAIFTRRVRAGSEVVYENWLSGITEASAGFAGNLGTTILQPADGRDDYVAITHFDSARHLQTWIDSPERKGWLERLSDIPIEREYVASNAGMERWFTLPDRVNEPPPRYKSAVLVVLGLYPLVMLLSVTLGPLLEGLPMAVRTFVSMVVSVALMVWFVSPALTRLFAGWLAPASDRPDPEARHPSVRLGPGPDPR